MKKIIYVLITLAIATTAYILGGRSAIDNMYIELLEPQEVPETIRDGSNFYYAIFSDFFKEPVIY